MKKYFKNALEKMQVMLEAAGDETTTAILRGIPVKAKVKKSPRTFSGVARNKRLARKACNIKKYN